MGNFLITVAALLIVIAALLSPGAPADSLAQELPEPTPSATLTPVATVFSHVLLPAIGRFPTLRVEVFEKDRNQFITIDVLTGEDVLVDWRLFLMPEEIKMDEGSFGAGPKLPTVKKIRFEEFDLPFPLPPAGSYRIEVWFPWWGGEVRVEKEFTYTPPTPTATATATPTETPTAEPPPAEATPTPEAPPQPERRR